MLNVSNVQHFSTGDGDGIRTTVFLKGCNLRCPWCHNPETLSSAPVTVHYKHRIVSYGKMRSVEELVKEILQDKDFYEESGGGVTVSGGEPMLQAEALKELLIALQKEGISVIVDTAGNVEYAAFEKINEYVDEYYFDIKGNSQRQYDLVKGDFQLVVSNLNRLTEEGKKVRVRIPLIPEVTDSALSVEDISTVLLHCRVKRVDLLPFHRLAVGKYQGMGLAYAYKDTPLLSTEEVEEIASVYRKYFEVKIER